MKKAHFHDFIGIGFEGFGQKIPDKSNSEGMGGDGVGKVEGKKGLLMGPDHFAQIAYLEQKRNEFFGLGMSHGQLNSTIQIKPSAQQQKPVIYPNRRRLTCSTFSTNPQPVSHGLKDRRPTGTPSGCSRTAPDQSPTAAQQWLVGRVVFLKFKMENLGQSRAAVPQSRT
jgi:hypothetical protein